MTEKPIQPPSRNASLGDKIAFDTQNLQEESVNILPDASQAAERVVGEFRGQIDEAIDAAKHDSLTGLLHKGPWLDSLKETLDELPEGHEVAVFVADVDRFKRINDTEGHAAGDEVLKLVAGVFSKYFRRTGDHIAVATPSDVARIGGDEFAGFVVTDRGNNHRNQTVIESITRQIGMVRKEVTEILLSKGWKNGGISFGITLLQEGDTATSLLYKADMEMYADKYGRKTSAFADASKEELEDIKQLVEGLDNIGHPVEPWLRAVCEQYCEH